MAFFPSLGLIEPQSSGGLPKAADRIFRAALSTLPDKAFSETFSRLLAPKEKT
jgi:hypothetical protein